jgi:hypothetical protein
MRVYGVHDGEPGMICIPVAAKTARRAKAIGWNRYGGEFLHDVYTDARVEAFRDLPPENNIKERGFGGRGTVVEVEGDERVLEHDEAAAIGFWSDEELDVGLTNA